MAQENEPPFQLPLSPGSPYSFLPPGYMTSLLSRDRWLPQSHRSKNRSRLSPRPISSAPSNDSRHSYIPPLHSYRSRQPSPAMESVQYYPHAHQIPTSPRFHSYLSPKPERFRLHWYSSQFSSRSSAPYLGSAELPFFHVDAMDGPRHSGQEFNELHVPYIRPTGSSKGELSSRFQDRLVSSDVSPSQPDQTRRPVHTSPAKRGKPPKQYSSYANMLADIIYSHPRGKMILQEIYVLLKERFPDHFLDDSKATGGGWRVSHPKSDESN
jgi:hypothetical protein